MGKKGEKTKVGADKDPIVAKIPAACADEAAAVAFFEEMRWGGEPACPRCGDMDVYRMTSASGARQADNRWRCRGCKQQFTVRIGTVLEESRIPLRHWAYAFWRASTSKKGASALEIKRQTGLTYKSALFLMNRIRWAMAEDPQAPRPLGGDVEADETYVGGKPRKHTGNKLVGRATKKTVVFGVVERGGEIRARHIGRVTGDNLRAALTEFVDVPKARLISDGEQGYKKVGPEFGHGHDIINHSEGEYVRGDVHTNTIESFWALLKRGLHGTYHSVSKRHLHRYVSEFEFRYNGRKLTDGSRTALAIRSAEGKRLTYRAPVTCGKA